MLTLIRMCCHTKGYCKESRPEFTLFQGARYSYLMIICMKCYDIKTSLELPWQVDCVEIYNIYKQDGIGNRKFLFPGVLRIAI